MQTQYYVIVLPKNHRKYNIKSAQKPFSHDRASGASILSHNAVMITRTVLDRPCALECSVDRLFDGMVACSCESSTDYIRVRDGVEDDSPLMTTYCSSATDVVVTSSAETLSVELVSDEKKQRQGFAAQFAFIVLGDLTSDTATVDEGLLSPLLPPASGGLVVDVTTTPGQLQTCLLYTSDAADE